VSSIPDWRERLECRGRVALNAAEFATDDLLYRGFRIDELDDEGRIDVNTLRMPDLSCNWDRFSIPEDVKRRQPGCERDGCYAVKVIDVRYKDFATPVHDPICGVAVENYAHAEIRELIEGESVSTTPPKNRKPTGKARKVLRLEWRTHIVNRLRRVFDPSE
jgi:hypothetical protein